MVWIGATAKRLQNDDRMQSTTKAESACAFGFRLSSLINDTTYTVEGIGEAWPPQSYPFAVLVGGKAADEYRKEGFLEGLRPSKPPAWQATT